jgi:hypothetical protein
VKTEYSKEEDWRHVLICRGAKIRSDQILDKRFRNINVEVGIRRDGGCKNKGQ